MKNIGSDTQAENFSKYRPYLNNIDLNKRILEIGPLCTPMIKKNKALNNVFYADIRPTDEIKKLYKDNSSIDNAGICEIDYVVENSYLETFSGVEKFDYVLASHVIEHVPQLILFFQDVATVINSGGFLCLTIPDKRYCFDHFRSPTSFAEAYDIYRQGTRNHPMRVFDFFADCVPFNDPALYWREQDEAVAIQNICSFDVAKDAYERALKGDYVDVHFSVFTPESFLLLLYNMTRASLLPFKCVEFYTTRPDTLEFNAMLQLEPLLFLEDSPQKQTELESLIELMRRNKNEEVNLNTRK